jgi:hypothetical protein
MGSDQKASLKGQEVMAKDPRIDKYNLEGFNKPKRTPKHPEKSHVVLAKEGDEVKLIRFGQQGVKGSPPKANESDAAKARRKSFKARHAKNIARGKMSGAYWANKVKW